MDHNYQRQTFLFQYLKNSKAIQSMATTEARTKKSMSQCLPLESIVNCFYFITGEELDLSTIQSQRSKI